MYFHESLRSIESCINGGLKAEVILVDDGSTNPSYCELVDAVNSHNVIVRVYKKENGGQNSARLCGFQNATGKFILFLDSDDRLNASELKRVLTAALEKPSSIIYFNYERVSFNGTVKQKCRQWPPGYIQNASIDKLLFESDSLCTQLYSRDFLASVIDSGIKFVSETNIGEDLATSILLLLNCDSVATINATPYQYVLRESSILNSTPKENAFDIFTSLDRMLDQLSGDCKNKYESELEAICIEHALYWGSARVINVCGIDQANKKRISRWMKERYPNWRENKYLNFLSKKHGVQFGLITRGYWNLYNMYMQARRKVKMLVSSRFHD